MTTQEVGISGLTTAQLIADKEDEVLEAWVTAQLASLTRRADLISEADLRRESVEFLRAFVKAIASEELMDITTPLYEPLLQMLKAVARSRVAQGFTPSETATYVFGLKDSLLTFLQTDLADQPDILNREVIVVSQLLDKLGLYVFGILAQDREDLIEQQNMAILELSSPTLRI